MSATTNLSNIIDMTEGRHPELDKNIKELLSDIQVLARIVKYTVSEVEHLSVDEIIACIEQTSIETGTIPISPGATNLGKIESVQMENSIIGEGYITFDIRFVLSYGSKEYRIIINLEAQKSADYGKLNYHLENRIIFYLARLISSQKEVEFFHSDYDNIKKVYSIWICMDAKDGEESINKIFLDSQAVYGTPSELQQLDKMCGLIIRIRRNEDGKQSSNELVAMLETLLCMKDRNVKKKILVEDFGMVMTRELEGRVGDMCNLSEVYEEVGMNKGLQQGLQQAIGPMVKMLREFKQSDETIVERIVKELGVSKEEVEKYL